MNIYLQIASESFHFAKENYENASAMKFAEDAISWVHEMDWENDVGTTLPNTIIESIDGFYWLSSLGHTKRLYVNFPTLLNAVCAAYAFYLEGYDCRDDFERIDEDDVIAYKPLVDCFTTKQVTVEPRLQELSHEWVSSNLPF